MAIEFVDLSGVVLEGEEEGEVLFDITGRPDLFDDVDDVQVCDRSFSTAVADHYSQMVVNARHLTGDPSRADDIVQEAMIRAMRGWDGFCGRVDEHRAQTDEPQDFDDAVGRWLHVIVTNTFIDAYHHADRARRRERELEQPEPTIDPAEQQALASQVAEALAGLPEDDRALLVSAARAPSSELIAA